jgi:hypothetical protein
MTSTYCSFKILFASRSLNSLSLLLGKIQRVHEVDRRYLVYLVATKYMHTHY